MNGNFYGVDIKLDPNNKPYLIEVNGENSGDAFSTIYGDLRFNQRVLTDMHDYGRGKPTIISGGWEDSPSTGGGMNRFLKSMFLQAVNRGAMLLNSVWGRRSIDLKQEWIREPYKIANRGSEIEAAYGREWETAAEQLGIDFKTFISLKLPDRQTILATAGTGKTYEIRPDSIGSIQSSDDLFSKTNAFDSVLINPYPIRVIVDSKIYQHRLLEDSEIADNMPATTIYGFGTIPDLSDILSKSDRFIRKPNSGGVQRGVASYSLEELNGLVNLERARRANMRQRQFFDSHLDRESEFSNFLVGLQLKGMERYTYLIQEFIPSKPFKSSDTGRFHDSCIRAFVYNGKFIDAHHRLAKEPMDAEDSPLKFVAGLSSGGRVEAMSDEDKGLVADFSEQVIRTLEDRIGVEGVRTNDDLRKFRERFWRDELARVA